MHLDHVAARVVDEDLLSLGPIDAGHRPVCSAELVELGLGRLDIGNRKRHMWNGGILARPFGQWGGLRTSDEMDLPIGAGIDPEPRHPWDCGTTRICIEAEHSLVEILYGIKLG